MSDILSQEEIEALLATLADDDGSKEQTSNSDLGGSLSGTKGTNFSSRIDTPRRAVSYELYDFRRPDKFSKDHLKTLQMIHETFARLSSSSLSAYLRSQIQLELISIEQVPYEEYLRSINRSVFTIFSVPPLTGQAVLEIEFSLIFNMIDRMLGGPGRTITRSNLTDIERPLVIEILQRVFSGLKTAWEQVLLVEPSVESVETSSQFVQIAPPSDVVVTILFEVKSNEQRGAMSLCIPYSVLKPVAQKLSAQKWFDLPTKKAVSQSRDQIAWQLSRAFVNCAARLGCSKISVKELLELGVGDMIRLESEANKEIQFMVSGEPKFDGKPALKGKKLVFCIQNILQD